MCGENTALDQELEIGIMIRVFLFPNGGDRQIEIEIQEVFGVHFKIGQKSLIGKQCNVFKEKLTKSN